MSYNIFYTEVDKNLQTELNARGRAGMFDRSNKSLDYMLGKVANVKLTAYESSGSTSAIVYELGGAEVRGSRYQPNTFLSDPSYTQDQLLYDDAGSAYTKENTIQDVSRRVGPYISDATVNIGDHSFGLLNKADINIVIPNVDRDLDTIEHVFFRPGRYVRIDITHPENAVITRDSDHGGLLLPSILPNQDKLKTLYPNLLDTQLEKLKLDARRINSYRFEGLITNFNFSYDKDGVVNASIKLTGTSNVYTDVSMFQNSDATKEKEEKEKIADPENTTTLETVSAETGSNYTSEFYENLYDIVDQNIALDILLTAAENDIIPISDVAYAEGNEIEYILNLDINTTEKLPTDVLSKLDLKESHYNPVDTNDQWVLKGDPYPVLPENIHSTSIYDYRYITLGALIEFINGRVLSKTGGEASSAIPLIMCNELTTISNYYSELVSADPESILLLPKTPGDKSGMNSYGGLQYYQNIISAASQEWPGVWEEIKDSTGQQTRVLYPSRIFINLSLINSIVTKLSNTGNTAYTIKGFLAEISSYINMNTAGAIDLKLVTHPTFQDALLFADVKCLKPIPETKSEVQESHSFVWTNGETITIPLQETDPDPVQPYIVPMFANHPEGTICRDFKFSASLPENAKNLSYVLNTSDAISENDIAPFMNFMYTAGAGDADAINKFREKYEQNYNSKIEALTSAKLNFGNDPTDEAPQLQLRKALYEYMKFPTPNIQASQLASAPVFPFQASFTIDGVNGLRYGDVLIFHALPSRYKVNTVFSIIGITHNVTTQGQWTTGVNCIMRPNIK